MAIKVQDTTIIDNDRSLKAIESVDAATQNAFENAGFSKVGSNEVAGIAYSCFSQSNPVCMTKDGKLALSFCPINEGIEDLCANNTSTPASLSTPKPTAIAYDSTRNKILSFFRNDANDIYYSLGLLSPSSYNVSMSTSNVGLVADNASSSRLQMKAIYDSVNDKVVLFYFDDLDGYLYAVVGEIDDLGFDYNFGTPVELNARTAADTDTRCIDAVYIEEYGKIALIYQWFSTSYEGYVSIGLVSVNGNTASYSEDLFESGSDVSITYIEHLKCVATINNRSSGRPVFRLFEIDGDNLDLIFNDTTTLDIFGTNLSLQYDSFSPYGYTYFSLYVENESDYRYITLTNITKSNIRWSGGSSTIANDVGQTTLNLGCDLLADPASEKIIATYGDKVRQFGSSQYDFSSKTGYRSYVAAAGAILGTIHTTNEVYTFLVRTKYDRGGDFIGLIAHDFSFDPFDVSYAPGELARVATEGAVHEYGTFEPFAQPYLSSGVRYWINSTATSEYDTYISTNVGSSAYVGMAIGPKTIIVKG